MPADTTTQSVSFENLRFFSPLFRDYCRSFELLAAYYSHDYRSLADRMAAADAAASRPRDRDALASILRSQNLSWGAGEATLRNIERLRDGRSVAVVTGQQLGLFTGPLYTILKTITVLRVADELEAETERPVVPVFWLEGEDHDFAEVAWTALYTGNEVARLKYGAPPGSDGTQVGPMGRVRLTSQIEEVVRAMIELLPPSDFKADLTSAVQDVYRAGNTFLDAFAGLMSRLFGGTGLVLISPDDPQVKQLARPLFLKEVRETRDVASGIHRVSEQLRQGYHAQINVRPSNLFLLEEDGRHALDEEDSVFVVRGTDRRFPSDALSRAVDEHPERFSGNVVLRPLVQDTLLPTAIYVAGPSEVAYFAQLRPAYEWAGIPMPVIFPRVSATIVERKVKKVMDEYELSLADFDQPLEELFQRLLRERIHADVDAEFERAAAHVDDGIDQLKPVLERLDPTLLKSAEATRAAIAKEFDRFRHRALKAQKRSHEQVRERLEKAQINLFPFGRPQERVISVLYFLNKYGPGFLMELKRDLSLDTSSHQLIFL